MEEQLMALSPADLREIGSSVLVRTHWKAPPRWTRLSARPLRAAQRWGWQGALRAGLTGRPWKGVRGSGSHTAWVFTAATERPVLLTPP